MNELMLETAAPWLSVKPEGVSLLGLPAEHSAKRSLPGTADDILKNISSILDGMIAEVIAKRTAIEFREAVREAFPRYASLVQAFAKVAVAVVRKQTISRVAAESFAEMEADLREHGLASFGEHMRERGVFTVWTLRKTSDLLAILEKACDDDDEEKDRRFHKGFITHALWARFHVDCLIVSMQMNKPLYPDVLPAIDDGLRAAVNAYAWVKQAVDLRFPVDETEPVPAYWSDEDRELLDASMADLERDNI